MLEILFESSRDKLALMSAYIGEKLSTVPLLKAHSIILEDKSKEDVGLVIALVQEFLVAQGQHGFKETLEGQSSSGSPSRRSYVLGQARRFTCQPSPWTIPMPPLWEGLLKR